MILKGFRPDHAFLPGEDAGNVPFLDIEFDFEIGQVGEIANAEAAVKRPGVDDVSLFDVFLQHSPGDRRGDNRIAATPFRLGQLGLGHRDVRLGDLEPLFLWLDYQIEGPAKSVDAMPGGLRV